MEMSASTTPGRVGSSAESPPDAATFARSPATEVRDVLDALVASGLVSRTDQGEVSIEPRKSPVDRRRPDAPVRFHVERRGSAIATVKSIPTDSRFDVEAVRHAYSWMAGARAFRPIRLLGEHIVDNRLILVEEYFPDATTLDDLVREGRLSPDEATARLVRIADDIWRLGEPPDRELLERELAALRAGFNAVIESPRLQEYLFKSFSDMIRARAAELRTVLSTRDLIGRNVLFGLADECVLVDFDLAHRTMLFGLDVARNRIHVPYCTQLIFDAAALRALDRELVDIAAAAAEFQLQLSMQPESAAQSLHRTFQTSVLRIMAPEASATLAAEDQTISLQSQIATLLAETGKMRANEASYLAKQDELMNEIEKARAFQSNMQRELARMAELNAEIEKARTYQAHMELHVSQLTAELDAARSQSPREIQEPESVEQEAMSTNTIEHIQTDRTQEPANRPEPRREKATRPGVDLMAVSYNSQRWLPGFINSLCRMDYPAESLRLIVIDNGSTDESVSFLKRAAADLPFAVEVVETGKNLGFAGGHNVGFQHGKSEYYFVVNLDTEIEPDTLDKLVTVLENDPKIGIAEARQSPHEHPKYFDAVSGETSWCSGACMMIRPRALQEIGGGFEEFLFMYLEDVDLSWRMWLHGWKCVYVRDAVIQHFTESLNTDKHPSFQHYFTMRNSALMRAMYATKTELLIHYLAMLRVGLFSRNPWWHKKLTLKAIIGSLRRLLRAFRMRAGRADKGKHKWVFFNGWLYGRHSRDPALNESETTVRVTDLVAATNEAKRSLEHDLQLKDHIVAQPSVTVSGVSRPAILTFDSARLEYTVAVPVNGLIRGWVAAPGDIRTRQARGKFTIEQNGEVVWEHELSLDAPEGRMWSEFAVPLTHNEGNTTSRIVLRYQSLSQLVWGLWGSVGIHVPAKPEPTPPEGTTDLAISVVVPTHNRADQLRHVIRRLMSQHMPAARFEVIVVDSKSADHTPEVLRELAATYPNLSHVRCEVASVAATRNMGLNRAKAPLVVLLDDDILVGSDFLPRILKTAQRKPGRILLARIAAPWSDSCDPFERFLWQSQDVNIYNFDDPDNVPPTHFYTAAVAIPREVLRDIRFDETFKGAGVEDIEFGFRLLGPDARMVFMPNVEVLHEYFPKYEPYREKKYRHGYWLGYFLDRHPVHRSRFYFEPRVRRFPRLLRFGVWATTPVAAALQLLERIHYSNKPLNRWLYQWIYHDLRLKMYKGVRDFERGVKL